MAGMIDHGARAFCELLSDIDGSISPPPSRPVYARRKRDEPMPDRDPSRLALLAPKD